MRFRGRVELGGKTATGITVPEEVVTGLGSGRRPAVRITVGGHTYRTTVAPMGGAFFVPLNAANRAEAGVAAGDEVDVDIELDTEPRTVTVPDDLAEALASEGAREAFDALSYTKRRERVTSISEAKTEATRSRRIRKIVAELTAG
ncbi:YdeI/OmpD-associated family protein [Pseudonocardia spinosispora]|uniref:YdeI/OmpD-associated family protein n=1 Tax=Pseudonocardia spinosispora TaxID=103441 RepID=UPI000490B959|nr:YdeI/OmpD-associated family protein [Pseudonocardia spinosispora]